MNLRNFYAKFHFFLFPLILIVSLFIFHKTSFQNRTSQVEQILNEIKDRQEVVKLYANKVKLEAQLNQFLKRFFTSPDFKLLMTSVSSVTDKEKIEIISIQPQPIKAGNFYREISVSLELKGSYHQIGKLAEAMDNSEFFLEIKKLKMLPRYTKAESKEVQLPAKAKDGSTLLDCNIEIATIVPNL